MSRIELAPRADRPDVSEAHVGWDRPLRTFFAQVYDRDEELILWEGTGLAEIATAERAIALLEPFAQIPIGLAELLERERAESAAAPDGPLQQLLKSAGLIR